MGKYKNLFIIVPQKQIPTWLEKPCSTCGISKPLKDFHPRKDSPDGRSYQCRDCKNAADRARYKQNPRPEIEAVMKWNKENRERHLANMHRYNIKPEVKEKRRPKQRLWTKAYRERHKEEVREKGKLSARRLRERWTPEQRAENHRKQKEYYQKRKASLSSTKGVRL